ncbi:MAG: CinA family protein [Beijerinckiaceae bacterium]
MFSAELTTQATAVLDAFRARGWRCVTAESCTGGLVSALLTAIPGSSNVVDRGFVTYSNAAKRDMLGVSEATLVAHGAVSLATAEEMARGALTNSDAQAAVSITGVAGPGGGSADKPVGLVIFGLATSDHCVVIEKRFGPLSRDAIRECSVRQALAMLEEAAAHPPPDHLRDVFDGTAGARVLSRHGD